MRRVELSCQECGSSFLVRPYRKDSARFCSKACGGAWQVKTHLNSIPKTYMLGNKLRVGLKPANAFTSEQVRGSANPNWKDGTPRVCEFCKTVFSKKPWIERQNGPTRFCSRKCFLDSGCFVAEKSSVWVGGPLTYRGRGWKALRLTVVAEQKGCCADCNKLVGLSLPVHHIKPFREFTSTAAANARSNLVDLCQSCHMKRERKIPLVRAPNRRISDALSRPDLFVKTPRRAKQEAML